MDPNATQSTPKPSPISTPMVHNPSTHPSDARVVSQSQDSERLLDTPDSPTDQNQLEDASQSGDNPSEHSDVLLGLCQVFGETCQSMFNVDPHPWQTAVAAKFLESVCEKKPTKYLCVRPTGGGKSLVFNVIATLLKDVTICICPLLSLGANQTEKTLAANSADGQVPLISFHLDEMRSKSVNKLKDKLRDNRARKCAVIIYMSPQSFATKKGDGLIRFLIRNDLIQFVVLDKIHLATSFGNTFRKEFAMLPAVLFSKLKKTCRMLFLTATCTKEIRFAFESLMKLEITKWHWPSPNQMKHRSVSIDLNYTTQPFRSVMNTFKAMVTSSDDSLPHKVIVYSNTRKRIMTFADSLRKRMNSDPIMKEIDIISLVGTFTKEEKARKLRTFVNGSSKHPELKIRVLCATSGVGNAGIDCPDVRAVYRIDFPPSILDIAQEKGRAGRRADATPENFHYFLC